MASGMNANASCPQIFVALVLLKTVQGIFAILLAILSGFVLFRVCTEKPDRKSALTRGISAAMTGEVYRRPHCTTLRLSAERCRIRMGSTSNRQSYASSKRG